LIACLLPLFCLGAMAAGASAAVLSLQATSDGSTVKTEFLQGDDLILNVIVDDASGIAGCAFTIYYPTDVLEGPEADSQGLPVNAGDISSFFPFTYGTTQTHRAANDSGAGELRLAGAEIDTGDGGGKYGGVSLTLFSIRFRVLQDATFMDFEISLESTRLFNPAAGWGNDLDGDGVFDPGDSDEALPLLVGAVDNGHADWGNPNAAFPVVLDTMAPFDLALYVGDGDSLDDAWEMANFGSVDVADDTTDFDNDGYLDRYELLLGTDPDFANDPLGEYYDASTDSRLYQFVVTSPESPAADAGATFNMDLNYFTSDDNNQLSGMGLRIHYNSSRLTWVGFSNVLPTSKTYEDTDPQSDMVQNYDNDASTDSYVEIVWDGGPWPNEPLETRLLTVAFEVNGSLSEGDTSTIRFTSSDSAPNYTFYSDAVAFEVRPCMLGDVNEDGEITAQDAVDAFWLSLEGSWSSTELCTADYNQDGEITSQDAVDIFWESLN